MTTNRQKAAVRFCEQYLDVTFKGDINDFHQISKFLSIYVNTAKRVLILLWNINPINEI